MNLLDLAKATIICGGLAFVIYNWPDIGKFATIGLLTLVWLMYAHRTFSQLLRK